MLIILMVMLLLMLVMMLLMMVMLVLVLASPRPSFIWCHTHYPPLLTCTNLTDDGNLSFFSQLVLCLYCNLETLQRDVTLLISLDLLGKVNTSLLMI